MVSYRIKENVSGKEVWDYLEGLIDDIGARVRMDDDHPMAIIFGFGSLRRSIIYWMHENLREPIEEKGKEE